MESRSIFTNLTHLIAEDRKFGFTLLSYVSVTVTFMNLNTISSPIIGIAASVLFFLINSTLMGQAFFQNENLFIRFLLGNLLLVVTLGLIGWVVLILFNLDNIRTTIVLLVATTLASILNRRAKTKNATT